MVCIILARVFIVVIMYVIMYPEDKKRFKLGIIVITYVVMWPILYDVIMYGSRERLKLRCDHVWVKSRASEHVITI